MITLPEATKQRFLNKITSADIIELNGKHYILTSGMDMQFGPDDVGIVRFKLNDKVIHEAAIEMHSWKDLYKNEVTVTFTDMRVLLEIRL